MVGLEFAEGSLLQQPSNTTYAALERSPSTYKPLHTFKLDKDRPYQQQYGDMYFLRLTKIKPVVEQIAAVAWGDTVIGENPIKRVDRVLDVRQGQLCWVAGTVYMDMALKPNILEDVSKDKWTFVPVASQKYYSTTDGDDKIMLEDDSGRIQLVGDVIQTTRLVTGCIVAIMGTENANGEFEVLDVKVPNLPPQPKRWALSKPPKKEEDTKMEEDDDDDETGKNSKIAIVSGLAFHGGDASYAMELNLLLEYLLGEALGPSVQKRVSRISRLVIAGNSIAPDEKLLRRDEQRRPNKKYGYDASAYNPVPSQLLDDFLADLLPSLPVTLLPGETDPANTSFPQQPIHTAMFPKSRAFAFTGTSSEAPWFDSVTNPWEAEVDGWRVLGTGGQNIDDIFKYVDSEDRLGMMEATCRWRCSAPTAPDTLWSYPFQDDDPFVMKACPHIYFVGCQPEFGTKLIYGPDDQVVRLITVPSFSTTGEIVLVDTETLDVERVKITTR